MIKEAKKEEGTDDFLGHVALKLQVVNDVLSSNEGTDMESIYYRSD